MSTKQYCKRFIYNYIGSQRIDIIFYESTLFFVNSETEIR